SPEQEICAIEQLWRSPCGLSGLAVAIDDPAFELGHHAMDARRRGNRCVEPRVIGSFRQAQRKKRSATSLQGFGIELIHEAYSPKRRRAGDGGWRRVDEGAIDAWAAVAAAKLAVDADHFTSLGRETRKVSPR